MIMSETLHTVARHNETPVKSILLSRDKNILLHDLSFISHWSVFPLRLSLIQELKYMQHAFSV